MHLFITFISRLLKINNRTIQQLNFLPSLHHPPMSHQHLKLISTKAISKANRKRLWETISTTPHKYISSLRSPPHVTAISYDPSKTFLISLRTIQSYTSRTGKKLKSDKLPVTYCMQISEEVLLRIQRKCTRRPKCPFPLYGLFSADETRDSERLRSEKSAKTRQEKCISQQHRCTDQMRDQFTDSAVAPAYTDIDTFAACKGLLG